MKQKRIIFFVFTLCIYLPAQGQDGEAGDVFSNLMLEEVIVTLQKIGQRRALQDRQ